MEVYTESSTRQESPQSGTNPRIDLNRKVERETPLAREDRRLLLGASLRLLGHRFICGKPILQDDVIRMASLADDAREHAA
jgi:hypothetical protein